MMAEEQTVASAQSLPVKASDWLSKKIKSFDQVAQVKKAEFKKNMGELGQKMIKQADTTEAAMQKSNKASMPTVEIPAVLNVVVPENTALPEPFVEVVSTVAEALPNELKIETMPAPTDLNLPEEKVTDEKNTSELSASSSPVVALEKPAELVAASESTKELAAPSAPVVAQDNHWNSMYVVGGVAAATTVVVGAIAYWYMKTSWYRAAKQLVAKGRVNPNMIINDLSDLLDLWDGLSQQQEIIEFVETHMTMTPEVAALLELYKYKSF